MSRLFTLFALLLGAPWLAAAQPLRASTTTAVDGDPRLVDESRRARPGQPGQQPSDDGVEALAALPGRDDEALRRRRRGRIGSGKGPARPRRACDIELVVKDVEHFVGVVVEAVAGPGRRRSVDCVVDGGVAGHQIFDFTCPLDFRMMSTTARSKKLVRS